MPKTSCTVSAPKATASRSAWGSRELRYLAHPTSVTARHVAAAAAITPTMSRGFQLGEAATRAAAAATAPTNRAIRIGTDVTRRV